MHNFYFNGKRSSDFGLRIKNALIIPSSERDYEIQEVPGADGDIYVSKNRLKSSDFVFSCRMQRKVRCNELTLFEMRDAITSWLMADEKMHDLVFDGDPNYIYRALHIGGEDLQRITSWAGDIDIAFRIYPWKYHVSGKQEITAIDGEITLINQFAFSSLPLIKVQGTGDADITFTNGNDVQTLSLVNLDPDEEITIDCGTEESYSGSDNRSYRVESYPFPELKPGQTVIEAESNISSLKITPRWRMQV